MGKILALLFFLILLFPRYASAYYDHMPASLVLGQPDFSTNSSGITATTLNNPIAVHSDGTRLFVTDINNHRVLIWNNIPTQNGEAPDIVLGQPDFSSNTANNGGVSASSLNSPASVFSDGTRLVVSDNANRRVLIWNTIPTSNMQAADVVVGQPDFSTTTGAVTASKFNTGAIGVYIYQGKLFVAEANNRRVLIYNSVPTTNGASADVVVGQEDFVTAATSPVSASQFANGGARGIAVWGGKMFVSNANRILIWNSIPTSNFEAADIVLGQPDFTSTTGDNGGISCSTFNGVIDQIVVTGNGRLIVGDTGRVLIWNSIPTHNSQAADIVLGQPDCNTRDLNYGGLSATSLGTTTGNTRSGIEMNNKLYVADSANNRVLVYENISSTPQLNINKFEGLEDRVKVFGNVHLGEVGKYTLHNVRVSVNGGGANFVTNLDSGRSDGVHTIYEFSHEFEPWAGMDKAQWNHEVGYTLKISSRSENAEDTSLFYFSPLTLRTADSSLSFSVPEKYLSLIKDNIDHFEIWTNHGSGWMNSEEYIPTSEINEDGVANINVNVSGEVKVVAISKVSNWAQSSNTVQTTYVGSYINPNNYSRSSTWFPLQINNINGVTKNIISNFSPAPILTYNSLGYMPRFSGIAFNGATVAMRVTNVNKQDEFRDYFSIAANSQWSILPTLYAKSIINMSVYDQYGRYSTIVPFTINLVK